MFKFFSDAAEKIQNYVIHDDMQTADCTIKKPVPKSFNIFAEYTIRDNSNITQSIRWVSGRG